MQCTDLRELPVMTICVILSDTGMEGVHISTWPILGSYVFTATACSVAEKTQRLASAGKSVEDQHMTHVRL